jgi:hypothetical protein
MNVYSDPPKFGLTIVGEIEWSSGCYQFDITAVYRLGVRLGYLEDSGCSCPSPFDGQGVSDLVFCTPAELQAHLEKRQAERVSGHCEDEGYRAAEIHDLMGKVTQ